ncbi:MAG TPA: GGDEF domain-containing protein [Actinomycetota bacterium]|jgi:diguanylate cyclase (GGDEF)-like protein|nr:GGDEF domain-containing protein [Actinomycetota bacterium]
MITEPIDVLLVGLTDDEAASILDDDGFAATRAASLDAATASPETGAVVLALQGDGPLEALRRARGLAPNAAIVAVSDDAHAADATVALHAGAEDQLPRDATLATLLPRAVRYAVGVRRVRQELATEDEITELPNLRGFAAIAEHHVRMADRLNEPVVFVFVRLEHHERILREEGADAADALAREASVVILEAVRDSDLPARIAPDTICVLLTGAAGGAESLVLSRLVEAIATHDARSDEPRALALGVGTARYEPGSGTTLADILSGAVRGLTGNRAG